MSTATKVPAYKHHYTPTGRRYRVKQVSYGFIPQWRIWWLPFWSAFDWDAMSYACFPTLEEAREHIRQDNQPKQRPVIHSA